MKNLLILLSFIPQLLLAEQLNYFCEEIEDKALSFKGGKSTIDDRLGDDGKWSLFIDTKKNIMTYKFLNQNKEEKSMRCHDIEEQLDNGKYSLVICGPEKTDYHTQGYITLFDVKSMYFLDVNPVFWGQFPDNGYIKNLLGKCYKAD